MPYLQAGSKLRRGAFCAPVVWLALLLVLPGAAQAYWGAIAVDPATGATGVSYDYGTAKDAQRRARKECGSSHCRPAVWVFNQYAALVQKRNGAFVAGVGGTRNLAFRKARQRAHEPRARRVAWVFSG
jgi:Domain of unknown function (DUF4189)